MMTLDAVTETHLSLVYPGFASPLRMALEDMAAVTGRTMRITEALRSFGRQAALFSQGRTTPGPHPTPSHPRGQTVTNAPFGLSIHHYGVAADCAFIGADPYLDRELAAVRDRLWNAWVGAVERAGLRSGGDWGSCGHAAAVEGLPVDLPHAQIAYGMSVQEMHSIYDTWGVKALWTRFDTLRGVPPGTGWADRRLYDPKQ